MESIIGLMFFVLFIVWAIRIETNLYKIVDHLKNIDNALNSNKKEK